MDRRLLFALPGLLILVVVGIAAWFISHNKTPVLPERPPSASSTGENLTGQAIYTNGQFGFSIFYPETARADTSFKSYYHLPSSWRVNATASGTPAIAIVAYRTESDSSYPRYYDAEVRVGVSGDPKEVHACGVVGNGESVHPDTVIGGATFKTFTFSQAGMMQYLKGTSYRTVHEGKCFAIEKVAAGSSYRDDPVSSSDISDATLDAKYASLDSIVESFSFARQ